MSLREFPSLTVRFFSIPAEGQLSGGHAAPTDAPQQDQTLHRLRSGPDRQKGQTALQLAVQHNKKQRTRDASSFKR